jgi:hypothetical protein
MIIIRDGLAMGISWDKAAGNPEKSLRSELTPGQLIHVNKVNKTEDRG